MAAVQRFGKQIAHYYAKEAKKKDIHVHFGIDTAKPKYANSARAELNKSVTVLRMKFTKN